MVDFFLLILFTKLQPSMTTASCVGHVGFNKTLKIGENLDLSFPPPLLVF